MAVLDRTCFSYKAQMSCPTKGTPESPGPRGLSAVSGTVIPGGAGSRRVSVVGPDVACGSPLCTWWSTRASPHPTRPSRWASRSLSWPVPRAQGKPQARAQLHLPGRREEFKDLVGQAGGEERGSGVCAGKLRSRTKGKELSPRGAQTLRLSLNALRGWGQWQSKGGPSQAVLLLPQLGREPLAADPGGLRVPTHATTGQAERGGTETRRHPGRQTGGHRVPLTSCETHHCASPMAHDAPRHTRIFTLCLSHHGWVLSGRAWHVYHLVFIQLPTEGHVGG